MDLLLAAFNVGMVSVMDLLVNLVAVRYFGFNVVELGILNALWTVVFIPFVRLIDRLADAGRVNAMWRIGSVSMLLLQALMSSSIMLNEKPLIYAAYGLHAVVFASTRLAVSTYIFETRSSSEWNKSSIMVSRFRLLFESLTIILIASIGFYTVLSSYIYVAVLLVLIHLASSLVIREPSLKLERILYRLESGLNRVFIPVKGLLSLSYLEIGGSASLPVRIYASTGVSTGLIIIGLIGFRLGNEYLWTPLPYYLSRGLGLGINSILMIYGLGRAVAFLLYSVVRSEMVFKPSSFILGVVGRITILLALMNTSNYLFFGFLLGFIYLANDVIDSNLFLSFAKSRGGYGSGLYSLIGEAVSLVGTLTSGYIYRASGPLATMALTSVLSLLLTPVVMKYRRE